MKTSIPVVAIEEIENLTSVNILSMPLSIGCLSPHLAYSLYIFLNIRLKLFLLD